MTSLRSFNKSNGSKQQSGGGAGGGGFRNSLRNMMRRLLHKATSTQPPSSPAGDGSGGSSPAGNGGNGGSGGAGGGSGQHAQATLQLAPANANADAPSESANPSSSLPLLHLDPLTNLVATTPASATAATPPSPTHPLPHDNSDDSWSKALNGDFSDIVKSHAHDDEATILANNPAAATKDTTPDRHNLATTDTTTATQDSTIMAPPRPLTEQTRSTQKAPLPPSQATPQREENKENVPPEKLVDSLAGLKVVDSPQKGDATKATTDAVNTANAPAVHDAGEADEQPQFDYSFLNDPVIAAERAQHLRFIGEALDMARLALKINETPVGCVLVHDGKVIAKGMNATNVTRNGTRHAEYMALAALFSYPNKDGPRTTRLKPKQLTDREEEEKAARLAARDEERTDQSVAGGEQDIATQSETEMPDAVSETLSTDVSPHEGNEDGKKGHLYPYGQKILDVERVDRSIVSESVLYVTVEPCIMCASLLRQLKIKKVYFGAVNDKFGGTGGVFSLHANSLPVREDGQTASAHPIAKPIQLPDGTGGSLGVSFPPGGGDGGNVEQGYEIEGGWGRDDAVALLRRFYVQENGRAPVPRKKEGRAARLAAMMGQDGVDGDADDETVTPSEGADTNEAGDDVRKPSSESSFDEAHLDMDGEDLYEA